MARASGRRGPASGSSLWRIRWRAAPRQQPRVRLRGPSLSRSLGRPDTPAPGDIPAEAFNAQLARRSSRHEPELRQDFDLVVVDADGADLALPHPEDPDEGEVNRLAG